MVLETGQFTMEWSLNNDKQPLAMGDKEIDNSRLKTRIPHIKTTTSVTL